MPGISMSSIATSGRRLAAPRARPRRRVETWRDDLDVVLHRQQRHQRAADHRLILGEQDPDRRRSCGRVGRRTAGSGPSRPADSRRPGSARHRAGRRPVRGARAGRRSPVPPIPQGGATAGAGAVVEDLERGCVAVARRPDGGRGARRCGARRWSPPPGPPTPARRPVPPGAARQRDRSWVRCRPRRARSGRSRARARASAGGSR